VGEKDMNSLTPGKLYKVIREFDIFNRKNGGRVGFINIGRIMMFAGFEEPVGYMKGRISKEISLLVGKKTYHVEVWVIETPLKYLKEVEI